MSTAMPADGGHLWVSAQAYGGGAEEVCDACGIRRSDHQALIPCAEVDRAMRLPPAPKHDYDPFA